jgi:hypothetical protein
MKQAKQAKRFQDKVMPVEKRTGGFAVCIFSAWDALVDTLEGWI